MRTNYVLIDYESVQPTAIAVLEQEHFNVLIFVGEKQAKVAFEVAAALQRMGSKATYIKIAGTGPNALDFHTPSTLGSSLRQIQTPISISSPKILDLIR